MFLFQSLDLLALLGLVVQALVAWGLVAILWAVGRRERSTRAFADFAVAFLALAVALTVLTVRYFRVHDIGPEERAFWADDRWPAITSYVLYLGLKAVFGLGLVRGSHELGGGAEPPLLARLRWPVIVLCAALPLLVADVNLLLLAQSPLMVGCALLSLRGLARIQAPDSGHALLRLALIGLALSWAGHAVAVAMYELPLARAWLALNSCTDVAVQMALGIGVILSAVQTVHQRVRAAEREREELRVILERDERLRALGTLVSGVAHELNNPLTVILGQAEMLVRGELVNGDARVLVEQAERCRGVVRSLSALAGQSVHPHETIAVAELIARVVRGVASVVEARRGRLNVDCAPDLLIRGDRVGMEQVLSNLVINALHASGAAGVVTLAAAGDGEHVELCVADQGAGIPLPLRARVFEPFFTTKPQGTGLGLAIVHAIVRAHAGSIEVLDGPDGRGARFIVRLPRAVPAAPTPAPPAGAAPGSGALLVVDDDAAVRAVVAKHAQRRGWRVTEVDSAEAALALRGGWSAFDAILCDLRMPGMGGIGLHDLLAGEADPLLDRFVFVAGDSAAAHVQAFARRCRRPLLGKPFDFDELFRTLASAMQPS